MKHTNTRRDRGTSSSELLMIRFQSNSEKNAPRRVQIPILTSRRKGCVRTLFRRFHTQLQSRRGSTFLLFRRQSYFYIFIEKCWQQTVGFFIFIFNGHFHFTFFGRTDSDLTTPTQRYTRTHRNTDRDTKLQAAALPMVSSPRPRDTNPFRGEPVVRTSRLCSCAASRARAGRLGGN